MLCPVLYHASYSKNVKNVYNDLAVLCGFVDVEKNESR